MGAARASAVQATGRMAVAVRAARVRAAGRMAAAVPAAAMASSVATTTASPRHGHRGRKEQREHNDQDAMERSNRP